MTEGTLNLIIDNPTGGLTDGKLASDSSQAYPISVVVDTKKANQALYKIALRCSAGFKTVGIWELSFIGTSASKWSVADGNNYATEQDAEEAEYFNVLTGSEVISDKNHTFWLKAMTNGEEESLVDISTSLRVYGRCVPIGGA